MRLFANSILTVLLGFALLFGSATFDKEKAPPCKCKCGGEHSCPEGYSAYCECIDNKCSGDCIQQRENANDFAASVLSKITDKEVTTDDLQKRSKFYGY